MSAAASGVVVLSSTPDHSSHRTPQQIPYNAGELFGLSPQYSSPPPLVSPSELFRNLQSHANEPPQEQGEIVQKKTTKRATNKSKPNADVTEDKPRRGRKKTASEGQAVLGDLESAALESKDNASKKAPRSRAKRTDTQNKLGGSKNKVLTGKVSKSGNTDAPQDGAKIVKPLSLKSSSQKDTTKESDDWEINGLQLDEAITRRLDWTPTKDTMQQVVELEGDGDAGDSQKSAPTRNFSNFLSGYGFTGTACSQTNGQTAEDGGPTKRRRIELIHSRILPGPKPGDTKDKAPTGEESQQTTSGKKPKKTKKPTTLTARVTARYASDYTEDSEKQSLYFTNASGKRKAKTKTKSQEPEFIVLSPEAAVKSLDDQDLMFGTCSQLEREDSPTMLRDMQTAIHASESHMESKPQPRVDWNTSSRSTVSRFAAPRNLWSEASRDLDGAMAEAEVLDLVDVCDISQIPPRSNAYQHETLDGKQQEIHIEAEQQSDNTPKKEVSKPKGSSAAVRESLHNTSQPANKDASRDKETTSQAVEPYPQTPHYNGFTDAELSKEIATYGFKPVKGRQKMLDLLQKCWESKHGTNAKSNGSSPSESTSMSASTKLPQTESVPPKRVSSSKSNPRTKSAANRANLASESNAPAGQAAKRRQGSSRPTSSSSQKTAIPKPPPQKSFAGVEEIEDSEDETLPSPSRLQIRYRTHGPERPSSQSLRTSTAPSSPSRAVPKPKAKPTTTLSNSYEKGNVGLPDLATQINKAVRAQPRMSSSSAIGSKRPSWHEKILMYDPIVLEDFTTWLNTEGLRLVAEDREVGAGFVRTWCESKGICCCYK